MLGMRKGAAKEAKPRLTPAEKAAKKKRKIDVTVRFTQKEAEYLMRCGRLQSSIASLDKVLNNLAGYNLEHKAIFGETMYIHTQNLLATRAEAWLRLCKLEKALKDVDEILRSNSRHAHALAVKADALFQECQFEHALVNYERGLKVSLEPLTSRLTSGKTRACESIMKALADFSVFDGIEKVATAMQYRSPKQRWTALQILLKAGQIRRPDTEDRYGYRPMPQEEEDDSLFGFNNVRHLKDDQRHLRTLLMDPTVKVGNDKKFNIKEVLEEALQFLDTREKFWASQ